MQSAEALLLVERVDFDHDAVDLVVELEALRLPHVADLGRRVDRLVPLGERARTEAALPEPLQRLPMRFCR
jgi:hypothetical protein